MGVGVKIRSNTVRWKTPAATPPAGKSAACVCRSLVHAGLNTVQPADCRLEGSALYWGTNESRHRRASTKSLRWRCFRPAVSSPPAHGPWRPPRPPGCSVPASAPTDFARKPLLFGCTGLTAADNTVSCDPHEHHSSRDHGRQPQAAITTPADPDRPGWLPETGPPHPHRGSRRRGHRTDLRGGVSWR